LIYECIGKKAAEPYYIEQMCLNIYTFEELLYFLKGNSCILDENIINEELFGFIRTQLGLENLYGQLRGLRRRNAGIADLTAAIFSYARYMSEEEIEDLKKIIEGNSDVRVFMRRKSRGDFFFQNKRYAASTEEYLRALGECDDNNVKSDIYHKLSVIYLRSYRFKDAADCLKKEWEITKDKETLKNYLILAKETLDKNEYLHELLLTDPDATTLKAVDNVLLKAEEEAGQKVDKLSDIFEKDTLGFIRQSGELIGELKKAYRREFSGII